MTLLEVCEPLFQYICRLNRSSRKSVPMDPDRTRGEIEALLSDIRSAAGAEPGVGALYEQVELPLIFFVDYMIKESDLSFAGVWEEMAKQRGELAGDEKFFDLLEGALEDRSTSSDVLAVYYTCMGMGFAGWYAGQPEYLRAKMQQLSARIRDHAETDEAARICPEAYEHVDTSDLVQPPGRSLVGIAILLIGTVLVLFATNVWMYRAFSKDLNSALNEIIRAGEAPVAGDADGGAGEEG